MQGEGSSSPGAESLAVSLAAADEAALDAAVGLLAADGFLGLVETGRGEGGEVLATASLALGTPVDAAALAAAGVRVLGTEIVRAEAAWETAWRTGLEPYLLGSRFAVVPSGFDPPAGRIAIALDPGGAFGTGLHPTTAMCIELLEEALAMRPAAKALDVGTGSALLAIAAVKLGVGSVLGLDVDEGALLEARDNVAKNGVGGAVRLASTPVADVRETYPLVLGNLDFPTYAKIGADVAPRLARGGIMVVSGLKPHEDWPRPADFEVLRRLERGGWRAELCRRTPG